MPACTYDIGVFGIEDRSHGRRSYLAPAQEPR